MRRRSFHGGNTGSNPVGDAAQNGCCLRGHTRGSGPDPANAALAPARANGPGQKFAGQSAATSRRRRLFPSGNPGAPRAAAGARKAKPGPRGPRPSWQNTAMRIFVSSAREGLEAHRDAVIKAIRANDDVVSMEDFTASARPPLDVCLSRLQEEADLLALILGPRYGSISPTGLSFTDEEYRLAVRLGVGVLPFCAGNLSDAIPQNNDASSTEKYRRLLADVGAKHTWSTFSGAEELATAVASAISGYKADHGDLGWRVRPAVGWEEYFREQLNEDRSLNHCGALIGRDDELNRLKEFVDGPKRVGILYGPSGSGKSRLMLELAKAPPSGWEFLFIRDGAAWSDHAVRALPAKKCVLVADDAGRRSDLGGLFDLL